MGLFDNVKLVYPVAIPGVADPSSLAWQSKTTPAQFLEDYEIREDGSLWHKEYRLTEWITDPASPMGSRLRREDPRWVEVPFGGQLTIAAITDDRLDVEIRFWFKCDRVQDVQFEVRELPPPPSEDEIAAARDRYPVVEPELARKILAFAKDEGAVDAWDWRVFKLVRDADEKQRTWLRNRVHELVRGIECLESEEGRKRLRKAMETG